MSQTDSVKKFVLQLMALQQQLGLDDVSALIAWLQAADLSEVNSEGLATIDPEKLKSATLPSGLSPLSADQWMAIASTLGGLLPKHLDAPVVIPEKPIDVLRCAVASSDGLVVDGHFGQARVLFVYDVSTTRFELVDIRLCDPSAEDKNQAKADLIKDCQLLFVAAIGGPAAARVIRSNIYPMKVKFEPSIDETLGNLQSRLSCDKLPPWLMRILGKKPMSMDHLELNVG
jgi:nitrogen fixation protein NifX